MARKKKTKKSSGILLLLGCLALCMLLFIGNLWLNARSIGSSAGKAMGSVVGKVIGSLEGMTTGRAEGTEAGKQAGLSAEDTEVVIGNELRQTANLEVLVAGVTLHDFHSIGEDADYAALYLANGTVVFTVDLTRTDVTMESDGLHIVLPCPEGNLYVDNSTIDKVSEYQKHFFTGDAESGFDAYLNTMSKLQTLSSETVSNYDYLVEAAKEAAANQMYGLVEAVSQYDGKVIVSFRG